MLVSDYACLLYDELNAGWRRIEIRAIKPSADHSTARARHVTEAIWSNRTAGDDTALSPLTAPDSRDETQPGPKPLPILA